MPIENEILREMRALRQDMQAVLGIVGGPKGGRHYVSGAKAAAMLGVSYPTFAKRYVATDRVRPAHNGKYLINDIRAVARVNSGEVVER